MAELTFTAEAPASVEPHVINLSGSYQSDPDNLGEGADWRSAKWTESIRFVAVAPWDSVNKVISGVGVTADGNIAIGGGIDLSAFMVNNAVEEDQARMRALLRDPHRVLHRKDIAKIVLFLIEQWSGGKASII